MRRHRGYSTFSKQYGEGETAVSLLEAATFWGRKAITQLEPCILTLSLKSWLMFSSLCVKEEAVRGQKYETDFESIA